MGYIGYAMYKIELIMNFIARKAVYAMPRDWFVAHDQVMYYALTLLICKDKTFLCSEGEMYPFGEG